jgi:RNA polymerase sigma factor for flagellar operon FliA
VNPSELLTANLPLIERAVAFSCRRHHVDAAEQEDFGSVVKLRLIENDYAIIRKFEGRSSFATFIGVVIERLLSDYRIHVWGKWHASAEATRLGDAAVLLERLIHRDGRRFDEAAREVCRAHPELTRQDLERLAGRLPQRTPRRRQVDLAEADGLAASTADGTEEGALNAERRQTSAKISAVMRQAIDELAAEDRLILQLRFERSMTVAQVARALNADQKALYRRIEKQMRGLREVLERAGVEADAIRQVIGTDGALLDFHFANGENRPSTWGEVVSGGQEEISQ